MSWALKPLNIGFPRGVKKKKFYALVYTWCDNSCLFYVMLPLYFIVSYFILFWLNLVPNSFPVGFQRNSLEVFNIYNCNMWKCPRFSGIVNIECALRSVEWPWGSQGYIHFFLHQGGGFELFFQSGWNSLLMLLCPIRFQAVRA